MSPDGPGAQPFSSFSSATSQTTAFTAEFGNTYYVDASAGGFTATLPLLTAASKGSRIKFVMRGAPAFGTASPENVTIAPNALNSIGSSAVNTSILLSGGGSVLELESDGGTDWIINLVPRCPSTPATLSDADQTLTRLGPWTRYTANATTAAGRTFTFSNTGAVPGDIVDVSVPTHGANTITVRNAVPAAIATYAATVANGGRFVFNGTQFEVLVAGNSTT